jgi:acyl dehydratase
MPARKLYFENVRVGDELPALVKPAVDRVQLSRYAGATQDWSPIYVDEAFARALGMPSVVAPSSLSMGFLAQLVTDHVRGAQVRRLSAKFVRTLWPGDVLTCKGRVADRHGQGGRYLVEFDVWAENQRGELVARGQVTLRVFYSAEDEARARAGQPPVVVDVPRESIHAVAPLAGPGARPPARVGARGAKRRSAKPRVTKSRSAQPRVAKPQGAKTRGSKPRVATPRAKSVVKRQGDAGARSARVLRKKR